MCFNYVGIFYALFKSLALYKQDGDRILVVLLFLLSVVMTACALTGCLVQSQTVFDTCIPILYLLMCMAETLTMYRSRLFFNTTPVIKWAMMGWSGTMWLASIAHLIAYSQTQSTNSIANSFAYIVISMALCSELTFRTIEIRVVLAARQSRLHRYDKEAEELIRRNRQQATLFLAASGLTIVLTVILFQIVTPGPTLFTSYVLCVLTLVGVFLNALDARVIEIVKIKAQTPRKVRTEDPEIQRVETQNESSTIPGSNTQLAGKH